VIVCRQCGQRNDETTEFCSACGAFLEWKGEHADAPAPAPTPASRPPGPAHPARTPPPPPPPPLPAPQPTAAAERVRCLECGAYSRADNRFCVRCGATLDVILLPGTAPGPPAAPVSPAAPVAHGVQPAPVPAPAGHGLQPAEAKQRPAPVRPPAAPAPVAPGGPGCPQCGTPNEPGRRFCQRCGAAVGDAAPSAPSTPAPAPSRSWWQRLRRRGHGPGGEAQRRRQARLDYRRSLDLRFRILRWVAVLGGLGALAAGLGLAGLDPVSGGRDLWRRVFPRDERVAGLTAAADPADADRREFAAAAALDGAPDTAWAAGWQLDPGAPPPPPCAPAPGTGGADAALVLTLPEPTDLSKLGIQAGLPEGDADRPTQWRPRALELRYDDGCQVVELADEAGPQEHAIEAHATTTVRITVLDALAPTAPTGTGDLVALAEVDLYRPG
jgi:hypothetical protein